MKIEETWENELPFMGKAASEVAHHEVCWTGTIGFSVLPLQNAFLLFSLYCEYISCEYISFNEQLLKALPQDAPKGCIMNYYVPLCQP